MNSKPIAVRHNAAESRFEIELENGALAVAEYDRRGTDLVMSHTFVPSDFRGQGLAEKLVRVALEYAREERLRVVPACSYVDAFIRRHPEFQPLVMA